MQLIVLDLTSLMQLEYLASVPASQVENIGMPLKEMKYLIGTKNYGLFYKKYSVVLEGFKFQRC